MFTSWNKQKIATAIYNHSKNHNVDLNNEEKNLKKIPKI